MIDREETAGLACPDEAQWEAFLNGQLENAAVAVLDAHLRDCPACLAAVDRLSAHWTLGERVASDRPATVASGAAGDPRVAELLRRLPQRPPAGSGSGNGTAAIPTAIPRIPGIEELEPVASGGMGVVYRGRDVTLGRTVAVKVLRDAGLLSDSARARARRESHLCARIEHPNIVAVHAAGEVDGLPYLVMSWIAGPSLQKRLETDGPLPPRQAAGIARDLARGLERVHAYGVIHRDLKPDNILLSTKTEPPTPILIDFGLARTEDTSQQLTQTTTVLGTPGFMAPEQTGLDPSLGEVSAATDVHGLGAVLYAMLTGTPPYAAATATATMQCASRGELCEPALLDRRAPADLRTIVLKCLHTSPARRYRSAGELADDLERFLAGKPVIARPISQMEQLAKWARRRPVTATLAGLAAMMLVLAATGVAYHVMELTRANAEIRRSRDIADEAMALAGRSMERLTGASIKRMLLRGEPLDAGDQAYLQQVVEELERWPLGSDPLAGLRFRASGFRRVAELFYGVGDYEDALDCYRRELATLAAIEKRSPGDPEILRARLSGHYLLRHCLYHLRRPDEAIASSREAIALLEAAPEGFPRRERDLIDTRLHLGIFLHEQQQPEEGSRLIEAALAELAALRRRQPDNADLAVQEVHSLYNAQLSDYAAGRTEARREKIDRLVQVSSEALERFDEHQDEFTTSLSNGLTQQVNIARDEGRLDDAVAIAQQRRDLCHAAIEEEQSISRLHTELIDADLMLAMLFRQLGQPSAAAAPLDEAITIGEQLVAAQPAVFDYAMLLGRALYDRGTLHLVSGETEAAVSLLERQIGLLEPWREQQGRTNDLDPLVGSAKTIVNDIRKGGG